MKNLLKILGIIVLTSTTSTNVIACNNQSFKKKLNEIITTTNLEKIYVGQLEKPNKNQILEAIKSKNESASDLNENDFQFQNNPSATHVNIIGIGKYQGELNLTYQINNFKIITKNKFSGDIYRMLWTNDNNLYIGLICWNNNEKNNILFKSIDKGKTFQPIENIIGIQVNSIIIDNNKNIWVASDNGLYESTDGNNFIKIINDNIRSLIIDNNENIWVGANNGILYKSLLIKNQFKKIKNFNGAIWSLAFKSNSKNILYIGIAISGYSGNGELYTSIDRINFQKTLNINNEVTNVAIAPNGTIYVGTYNSYGKGNLYKSIDGINFTIVNRINYSVFSLVPDNNNNVYIGTELAVQKGKILKLDNENNLKETFGIFTTAWCLTIDSKKNIYAGTGVARNYSPTIYESEFINIIIYY